MAVIDQLASEIFALICQGLPAFRARIENITRKDVETLLDEGAHGGRPFDLVFDRDRGPASDGHGDRDHDHDHDHEPTHGPTPDPMRNPIRSLVRNPMHSSEHGSMHSPVRIEAFRRALETLVAPAADGYRESILESARQSPRQNVRQDARTQPKPQVALYAPLYLSNVCTNRCTYCGFRHDNDVPRRTLSEVEIEAEAKALASLGIEEVLLLTGEAPAQVGVDYLERAITIVKPYFERVAIEVFPMTTADYGRMSAAGAKSLTLYQETYDTVTYRRVHEAGRKRNFHHRLSAPYRALEGGIDRIGIGALLGLSDWRFETVALILHAAFLSAFRPDAALSVSFPRIRNAGGGFSVRSPVADAELIHMMSVVRLLLPQATLVLSTRESAALRDRLAGDLVQKLSAGSRTNPGGYNLGAHEEEEERAREDAASQFEVEDVRSPLEIASLLETKGIEVRGFRGASASLTEAAGA